MTTLSSLSPSGIPLVDARLGGLAPGSATLLVGRAGDGRSALALTTARAAADAGQQVLLLSPHEPQALAATAREDGIDLAAVYQTGRLRVLRIPDAATLAAQGDASLAASYKGLGDMVGDVARVVIEDFTPLVQFSSFEALDGALAGLRAAFAAAEVAFVFGIGAPANDASRQLLDALQRHADTTVRIETGPGGDRQITLAGAAPETTAPKAAAPEAAAPEAASPTPSPAPVPAPSPAPAVPSPPMPDYGTNDGASVAIDPPQATPPSAPAADPPTAPVAEPVAPTAEPEPAAADPAAPEGLASEPAPELPTAELPTSEPAPQDPLGADTLELAELSPEALPTVAGVSPDGLLITTVSPAPAADPDLLPDGADLYSADPADAMLTQGFLVDSAAGQPIHHGDQPTAPSATISQPDAAPAFSSLGQAPAHTSPDGFREALGRAFDSRDKQGRPFVVVAARMDGAAPAADYFASVVEGLRAGLPANGLLFDDLERKRAIALIPGGDQASAQPLFSGLQSHLRERLPAQAEDVLRAVAAITVPDGRPFETAADLWAYAVES